MGDDYEKGPQNSGDSPPVALVRPLFHELFAHLTFSDSLCLSVQGTEQQRLNRSNFTYGESSLQALSRVLAALSLPSYQCGCSGGGGAARGARCGRCGRRVGGAVLFDLGSGVGNVVVGAALLTAAGQVPLAAVHGVELLAPLHDAADAVLRRMRAHFAVAGDGAPLLPAPLPECGAHCADLLQFDWSGADVIYMASTIFTSEVMEQFSRQAVERLAAGARVVTLKTPLAHPAFVLEATLTVDMSWGTEFAHIHRNTWGAELSALD
jgi:hypothetical protein